jgi:hypothetical protein
MSGAGGDLPGLLTDGQRKSMQPMAERVGVDHQRCSSSSRPRRGSTRRYGPTRPGGVSGRSTRRPMWSTTRVSLRMARHRRWWPRCTRARWARRPTARSGSVCRWSPTLPRWPRTGGCTAPHHGTTRPWTMRTGPHRSVRVGPGRGAGQGAAPGEMASGVGHARPDDRRVGTAAATGKRRCRVRRCHRVPARPGRTGLPVRGGGQGSHQRLPRDSPASTDRNHQSRTTAETPLPASPHRRPAPATRRALPAEVGEVAAYSLSVGHAELRM